jgi:hypothetical protein
LARWWKDLFSGFTRIVARWWKDPFSDFTRIVVGLRSLVRTVQFASLRRLPLANWSVADNSKRQPAGGCQ